MLLFATFSLIMLWRKDSAIFSMVILYTRKGVINPKNYSFAAHKNQTLHFCVQCYNDAWKHFKYLFYNFELTKTLKSRCTIAFMRCFTLFLQSKNIKPYFIILAPPPEPTERQQLLCLWFMSWHTITCINNPFKYPAYVHIVAHASPTQVSHANHLPLIDICEIFLMLYLYIFVLWSLSSIIGTVQRYIWHADCWTTGSCTW